MILLLPPPIEKLARRPFARADTLYSDDGYTPKIIPRPNPPGRIPHGARTMSRQRQIFVDGRWMDARQAKFLEAYAVIGTISGAARAIGAQPSIHKNWMERHSTYRAAFENAAQRVKDRLWETAYKLGTRGSKKGIYYKGDRVASEYEINTGILAKLLDAEMPEKFKSARDENPNHGPTQLTQSINVYLPDNGRSGNPNTAALPAPGVGLPIDVTPARPVRAQVVSSTPEEKS
jgi:hypothetical protein